jgi:hypothetical protein
MERGVSWNSFGYDIKDFTVPERGQMKSNFLKSKAPEPVAEPIEPEEVKEEEPELTEEEVKAKRDAEIKKALDRQ